MKWYVCSAYRWLTGAVTLKRCGFGWIVRYGNGSSLQFNGEMCDFFNRYAVNDDDDR